MAKINRCFFLYFILLPPPNLPPRLPSSACKGTIACEELKLTIAVDRAGIEPAFPAWQRFIDRHAQTVTLYSRIKECTQVMGLCFPQGFC